MWTKLYDSGRYPLFLLRLHGLHVFFNNNFDKYKKFKVYRFGENIDGFCQCNKRILLNIFVSATMEKVFSLIEHMIQNGNHAATTKRWK